MSSRRYGLAFVLIALAIFSLPVLSQSGYGDPSDEVTLRIIVVSSPEKAQEIANRLEKGEDFVTLARQESIDSTADEGGLLGTVSLSSLRSELREAVAKINVGQISPVIRSPLGYAVLKVVPAAEGKPNAPFVISSTASTGSVRYVFNLGGFADVDAGFANFPKPDGWNEDPQQICKLRRQTVIAQKQFLGKFLSPENEKARASRSPIDLMSMYFAMGELNAYEGKMDAAVAQYEEAAKVAQARAPADAILNMDEALGIAYLHKSGIDNGVFRTPGDRCLVPTRTGNGYGKTADSQKAVDYFQKYLAQRPDDMEVRWLLNLAYMALGSYPDKVPSQYLIPPSVFASGEDVGRFEDVAVKAGLNSFATAGGVIVDDLENNGRLDIVTSGYDSCEPLHYFHNNGDGTFTQQEKPGLAGQVGGLNILQTDYNNDGCLDILVLRGAWQLPQRKSLLRNNCDGTFTDVTVASGLGVPTSTQTAVWVDVNNDGFLDLFVGNEGSPTQLFLNNRNGTFTDIANSAHVDRTMFTKGVTAADYDNDGWPDLYVSNLNGYNFLYHNNHDNTFTEVSGAWGSTGSLPVANVPGPGRGFATWFFDYDNDGWPDIFATSYFVSVAESAGTYLGLPHNATTLKLYKNMHDGTFRDVTAETKLDKVFMPMGSNFGDIDNDGFPDIYMGTGNPSYAALVPSVLLRNHEGKYFVDVTTSSGTGELHKGHGVAFADLGNRGQEDIVFEVGGATLGDAHALRLFENPGHGNDWITLKLVGVKTNRAAIGVRIKVAVENKSGESRFIYRTVGSGGSFGSSPLQQHIGLGKDARITDLEIWWPTSDTRQHFTNVGKNQFLEIKEFSKEYAKLERTPVRLGGQQKGAPALARKSSPAGSTGN